MRTHAWKICLPVMIVIPVLLWVIPIAAVPAAQNTICLTEFTLAPDVYRPFSLTRGPDDNLWFFEETMTAYRIAKITANGTVTEFPMVGTPVGMTAGPDGNVWYTQSNTNAVGRITPSGSITTFPISGTDPYGITAGPDGNLWITEISGRQIERVTSAGRVTGQFIIPTAGNAPREITLGADGNLWFIETNNKIGQITTSGVIVEFPITTSNIYLSGIGAGPDGNIWFTETPFGCNGTPYPGCPGKVGKVTPAGAITEFDVPWTPYLVAAGSDGNLWSIIAFRFGYAIARIATDGTAVGYEVSSYQPLGYVYSYSITSGKDGKVWLTETSGYSVFRNMIIPAQIARFNPATAGVLISMTSLYSGSREKSSSLPARVLEDGSTPTPLR